MEKEEIEYLNKYVEWEAYYSPKFKELFGFEMPTDLYGIDIMSIPESKKIEIMVLQKYGEEGINLLFEIVNNNPETFYELRHG